MTGQDEFVAAFVGRLCHHRDLVTEADKLFRKQRADRFDASDAGSKGV